MKTSSEIRFDYQKALEQARRLDALADSMNRRAAGRLGEAAQCIHAAWKGDSAARYLGKTQELRRQIRQNTAVLRAAAADVRRIARQIYEAEMRALEIARRRNA